MNEEIYKVGDILEIPANVVLPSQFGTFSKEDTCRCLVLNVIYHGFVCVSYTLLTNIDGFGAFDIVTVGHANIADHAKLIGHSDISALREESSDPDYKMMLTAYSLVEASNLRHELAAVQQKNLDLKTENAYLTHKLRDTEAQREKMKNERDDAEEKTLKLEEENGKLMQKISYAEKQLDEGSKYIYEALAHLSTVIYYK